MAVLFLFLFDICRNNHGDTGKNHHIDSPSNTNGSHINFTQLRIDNKETNHANDRKDNSYDACQKLVFSTSTHNAQESC